MHAQATLDFLVLVYHMASLKPTVNVTIDKEPDVYKAPFPPPPSPPSASFTPVQQDPTEIFKLAGMSFGVGVLVGGMLVFAFSKTPAETI